MSEHRLREVVIERPRGGMRISLKKVTGYKKQLYQLTQEAIEDGLLRPYLLKPRNKSKWLSDHLGPLRRFLKSKAGQSWDTVYSELCQKLDTRTVLGQHVLDHLWDYVERYVEFIDGIPYAKDSWRGYYSLESHYRDRFYIHPDTGILCAVQKSCRKLKPEPPPDDWLNIDDWHKYRKIKGLWYLVTYAEFPPPPTLWVWDTVEGVRVKRQKPRYPGDRQIYAAHKKQCNKKEIRWIKRNMSH